MDQVDDGLVTLHFGFTAVLRGVCIEKGVCLQSKAFMTANRLVLMGGYWEPKLKMSNDQAGVVEEAQLLLHHNEESTVSSQQSGCCC